DYQMAVNNLQIAIDEFANWANRWKIKLNENKSTMTTYTYRKYGYAFISINGSIIPQTNASKYLGLHLDSRLNWNHHIKVKRKELDYRLKNLHWLLGRKSKLSLENKRLLYNSILRPVWQYGAPLWGCAKKANRNIIQRFQNKTLRMMSNAPWYVSNKTLHRDWKILTVDEIISTSSKAHAKRLYQHPNTEAIQLLDNNTTRRLARTKTTDFFV
ncbi:unnamed protein product, partial [Allacma fusca]